MYELLVLTKEWVFGPNEDGSRHAALTKIINKSYAKSMFKFGIIKSERIKNVGTFLDDFSLTPEKDITIYVLLGPEQTFRKLQEEKGYTRDFFSPNNSLEDAFNCDIPDEFASMFDFSKDSEIHTTVVDVDFKFSPEQISRVLGTTAFKDDADITNAYELTAYTSFLRNLGPKLLDVTVDKFKGQNELILTAGVIREHNLVQYYTTKCGFTAMGKPDVLIEVENGRAKLSVLEDNILASQSFHISFIHRKIN